MYSKNIAHLLTFTIANGLSIGSEDIFDTISSAIREANIAIQFPADIAAGTIN